MGSLSTLLACDTPEGPTIPCTQRASKMNFYITGGPGTMRILKYILSCSMSLLLTALETAHTSPTLLLDMTAQLSAFSKLQLLEVIVPNLCSVLS